LDEVPGGHSLNDCIGRIEAHNRTVGVLGWVAFFQEKNIVLEKA
jgi:hypothetical protein